MSAREILVLGLVAYTAIGALLFAIVDRSEMRKPIPWANMPALPLNTLRAAILLGCLFWWPVSLVHAVREVRRLLRVERFRHAREIVKEYRRVYGGRA